MTNPTGLPFGWIAMGLTLNTRAAVFPSLARAYERTGPTVHV